MSEQFYDLSIETLDDGTIRLEQRDYCGESVIIDLHPIQAAFIADGLPVSAPERIQPQWATERTATLERRMLWMRDRFDECHAAIPSDIHERCAEAPEFYAWLQASIDVSAEFCADFSNAPSITSSNALASPFPATSVDGSLPSVAGCASEHPSNDLFPA